jgi:hypothetical protein
MATNNDNTLAHVTILFIGHPPFFLAAERRLGRRTKGHGVLGRRFFFSFFA